MYYFFISLPCVHYYLDTHAKDLKWVSKWKDQKCASLAKWQRKSRIKNEKNLQQKGEKMSIKNKENKWEKYFKKTKFKCENEKIYGKLCITSQ